VSVVGSLRRHVNKTTSTIPTRRLDSAGRRWTEEGVEGGTSTETGGVPRNEASSCIVFEVVPCVAFADPCFSLSLSLSFDFVFDAMSLSLSAASMPISPANTRRHVDAGVPRASFALRMILHSCECAFSADAFIA
jgi:hypothetical protein